MTLKQKKQHIESIKALLINNGFKVDRWGHYQKTKNIMTYRVKIMKTNLRFENKYNSIWFKIFSKPIVSIDIKEFNLLFARGL